MRLYADSSFLVSCYLMDANTAQAKTYLSGRNVSLIVTALHELEVRNALQLGVFRDVLTPDEARAATVNINADLQAGRRRESFPDSTAVLMCGLPAIHISFLAVDFT